MSLTILSNLATGEITAQNSTNNITFIDVIGNKTDVASNTADVASVIGLLRYIEANITSDADVAALLGALDTIDHVGATDDVTTIMGYVKQLVTAAIANATNIGTAVGADISTDIANVKSVADAIKLVTDLLPDAGALTSLAQDATVAKELTLADVKAVTDLLPDAGALTSLAQDATVAKEATLGTPVGADLSTDIANVQSDVTAIKAKTDNLPADTTTRLDNIDTTLTDIDNYIDTEVAAIKAKTDNLPADTTTRLDNIDTALTTIDDFLDTEIAAIKAVTDLLPDAGALTSLAQDATVAKEATLGVPVTSISADIAAIDTKIGTPVADLSTDISDLKGILDGSTANTDAIKREAGRTQVKAIAITGAANAGLTLLATVTTKAVLIKSIVLSSNGATTADLTSAAIVGGASEIVEFISAATAVKANIDVADEQVAFSGVKRLPATGTIKVDLQGTGATAVDLVATIEFIAVEDGGYLA